MKKFTVSAVSSLRQGPYSLHHCNNLDKMDLFYTIALLNGLVIISQVTTNTNSKNFNAFQDEINQWSWWFLFLTMKLCSFLDTISFSVLKCSLIQKRMTLISPQGSLFCLCLMPAGVSHGAIMVYKGLFRWVSAFPGCSSSPRFLAESSVSLGSCTQGHSKHSITRGNHPLFHSKSRSEGIKNMPCFRTNLERVILRTSKACTSPPNKSAWIATSVFSPKPQGNVHHY